jgi:hypothetical protein
MVGFGPLPGPMLSAKLSLWKYSIRSEGKFMLATLYKAKSNTENVRDLNLVAGKHTTFHFTKMPLLQKARPLYPRGGKPWYLLNMKVGAPPEPVEMLWIMKKFLIPAGTQTLSLPVSNLLNILTVLTS